MLVVSSKHSGRIHTNWFPITTFTHVCNLHFLHFVDCSSSILSGAGQHTKKKNLSNPTLLRSITPFSPLQPLRFIKKNYKNSKLHKAFKKLQVLFLLMLQRPNFLHASAEKENVIYQLLSIWKLMELVPLLKQG